MATFNTVEDLIRILDEDPALLEALQARLLTRRLLNLPLEFDEHRKEFLELRKEFDEHRKEFLEHRKEFLELRKEFDEFRLEFDEHRKEFLGLREEFDEFRQEFDEHRKDFSQLKGQHRGWIAFGLAEKQYGVIALEMGLEPERLVTPEELLRMTRLPAASEYDQAQINMFRDCDIVIKAVDPETDADTYVAVQVSYTIAHTDVTRARDCAAMLARLTGSAARAAVCGREVSNPSIEGRLNGVSYFRLRGRQFSPP